MQVELVHVFKIFTTQLRYYIGQYNLDKVVNRKLWA